MGHDYAHIHKWPSDRCTCVCVHICKYTYIFAYAEIYLTDKMDLYVFVSTLTNPHT